MKKSQNTSSKLTSISAILFLLIIWQLVSSFGLVPEFMLPSPIQVGKAFVEDFPLLMQHSKISLLESAIGLSTGVLLGFIMAIAMEMNEYIYNGLYPLMVLTQTVPTVAIAPLLVLWFGYGILPKIILIVIVTFFPIAIGFLDGFKSVDEDEINLLKAMNASQLQILIHLKIPTALPYFFAGLRIAASYSIVGAVISEWLGGFEGLGVYMTRVKKAYSFDKMFAVIFLISALSLLLLTLVKVLEKVAMPWNFKQESEEQ